MTDDNISRSVPFVLDGQEYVLKNGSVLIAAITSCTNTSNPSVMLGAGLLAKVKNAYSQVRNRPTMRNNQHDEIF